MSSASRSNFQKRPGVRRLIKSLALSFCLVLFYSADFCALPVEASKSLFDPMMKDGKAAAKARNYADAERLFEMALQNSEHLKPDSQEMVDLYDNLGQSYVITGKQAKAEEVLKKALEMREKNPKKDELRLFGTIMSLGTVYRRQDKYADSEQLYKRGLAMFEGKGPIKCLCQATVMYALGTLYLDMARPRDAETLLKQALEVRKESMLKSALSEQGIYDSLGRAYSEQGKMEEAEKSHRLALELARKGKDNRSTAFAESNLASVLIETSRYKEAKDCLLDAEKILEKTDGPDSNNVASAFTRLANLAIRQDRYEEAEGLLKKSLAIHSKNLGENNTEVGYDLSNLVDILRNQGKYPQAEEAGKKSLQIFQNAVGKENTLVAQALVRLSWVYADQAKFQEGEALSKEALRLFREKGGENYKDLPAALSQLAFIERGLKNTQEAEKLLLQSAGILERTKMPDQSLLSYTYSELASLYKLNNQLDKSEEYLKKSLSIREKIYGADHTRLLPDLMLLARIYESEKKADELASTNVRIAAIQDKHPELKKTVETPVKSAPIVAVESAAASRPVKNKWALVVGISNFANPEINLKYAAKDAVDFSNYLIKDARFAPDHVKLLTDQAATRENIIKQLGDEWLGRRAGPDDLVVIYVSSHGSVSRSEAGGVNFLVAHDTDPDALLSTGIPMQWLSQMIKEQVHSQRVVLVLDVCHSGASSGGSKGLSRDNTFDVAKVPIGEGQAVICSSAPEQLSWESRNYPNSVFTRRLIEGLQQNGAKADLNSAFSYLKEQVESEVLRDRGKLQTPLLFSKSWQGSPPVLSVETSSGR